MLSIKTCGKGIGFVFFQVYGTKVNGAKRWNWNSKFYFIQMFDNWLPIPIMKFASVYLENWESY